MPTQSTRRVCRAAGDSGDSIAVTLKKMEKLYCLWSRNIMLVVIGLVLSDGSFGAQPGREAKQENPLPRILRDWASRRQNVKLITYRFSGTLTWPQGGFTEPSEEPSSTPVSAPVENPLQDVTGMISSTVVLDFQNNRCRVEREHDRYDNANRLPYHLRLIEVGNGGVSYSQVLENTDPSLRRTPNKRVDFLIKKGARGLVPASSFDLGYFAPLFFASGVVPTADQRAKTVNFGFENNPNSFVFEGYTTEQGRRLAIMRDDFNDRNIVTKNRYWIDLENESAIVKFTHQLGGNPGDISTCTIQYGVTAGIWLPNHWTTIYKSKARTYLTESIAVSETTILRNIEPENFVLNPSAGMHIQEDDYRRDPQTKGLVVYTSSYRLNPDGSKSGQSSGINIVPQP